MRCPSAISNLGPTHCVVTFVFVTQRSRSTQQSFHECRRVQLPLGPRGATRGCPFCGRRCFFGDVLRHERMTSFSSTFTEDLPNFGVHGLHIPLKLLKILPVFLPHVSFEEVIQHMGSFPLALCTIICFALKKSRLHF